MSMNINDWQRIDAEESYEELLTCVAIVVLAVTADSATQSDRRPQSPRDQKTQDAAAPM